jgi:hypothetical protein
MSRRLSSPLFESLSLLKPHHTTSALRQALVGVPHTWPPSNLEPRRRTVLTSSRSPRTKLVSTPGAAGRQLLLLHKRYSRPLVLCMVINRAKPIVSWHRLTRASSSHRRVTRWSVSQSRLNRAAIATVWAIRVGDSLNQSSPSQRPPSRAHQTTASTRLLHEEMRRRMQDPSTVGPALKR